MGSVADHVALANLHQEALEFLAQEPSRFPEWITATAFYKAIHVIEAMAAAIGTPQSSDHRQRAGILKRDHRLHHISGHFGPIWRASCLARYMRDEGGTVRSFSDYMGGKSALSEMAHYHLHEIEQSAANLVKKLAGKDDNASWSKLRTDGQWRAEMAAKSKPAPSSRSSQSAPG